MLGVASPTGRRLQSNRRRHRYCSRQEFRRRRQRFGFRLPLQLTTAGATPMMLQIIARLELAGVKLSLAFQVAELVLKWRTNLVRVTLDPKAPEESGAVFELGVVQLDNSGRIVELLLNPVK